MKQTPLKRKTSLKAKAPLKARTPLKTKSKLKCRQKTARKLPQPYHSIFTSDMHICYITGATQNVEPHHIFGSSNKELSEKYGFLLPLRSDWHRGTTYSIHEDRSLSVTYKMRCQEYYINVLGKSWAEWQQEFGKWWCEEDIKAVRRQA